MSWRHINEDVNSAEPFPSVKIPWADYLFNVNGEKMTFCLTKYWHSVHLPNVNIYFGFPQCPQISVERGLVDRTTRRWTTGQLINTSDNW